MKFSTKILLGIFLCSTVAVGSYVIPNLSITTAKIAALAVTRAKLAAVGEQVSNAQPGQGTASATYIDINNMTVTITTTGRPVIVSMQSDGTGTPAFLQSTHLASPFSSGVGYLRFVRVLSGTPTTISDHILSYSMPGVTSTTYIDWPATIIHLDIPAAGTYTYKAQFKTTGDVQQQFSVNNVRMVAYEL